jgi:hypothetical protein
MLAKDTNFIFLIKVLSKVFELRKAEISQPKEEIHGVAGTDGLSVWLGWGRYKIGGNKCKSKVVPVL